MLIVDWHGRRDVLRMPPRDWQRREPVEQLAGHRVRWRLGHSQCALFHHRVDARVAPQRGRHMLSNGPREGRDALLCYDHPHRRLVAPRTVLLYLRLRRRTEGKGVLHSRHYHPAHRCIKCLPQAAVVIGVGEGFARQLIGPIRPLLRCRHRCDCP